MRYLSNKLVSLLLVIILLTLTACYDSAPPSGDSPSSTPRPASQSTAQPVMPLAEVMLPESIAAEDYESIMALHEEHPITDQDRSVLGKFAWESADLLLEAYAAKQDLTYSPLSLYYALGLAASGARGKTATELFDVLGVSDSQELDKMLNNFFFASYQANEFTHFKLANSAWLASEWQGEPVAYHQDWLDHAVRTYFATPFKADFSNPETGRQMAAWISEQTSGLLTPEIPVDPETIFALINTVYYSDQWVDQFDRAETTAGVFQREDGSELEVDYMHREYYSASYRRGEDYLSAPLQLKNSQITFVLPDSGTSISQLIADHGMQELLQGGEAHSGEVIWQIPKFATESDFEFTELLQTLGISVAFQQSADFTGITDHQAWISEVRQGTRLSLNEDGIEAAAFTLMQYAGAAMPEGRAEMILDRPFLYAITINSVPIFIGAYGGFD